MSTDALLTLGATVAGLIVFAIVMGRWEKAAKAAMSAADHFQVEGFEANIDRALNEVHIWVEGHERVFRSPLGHLVVQDKVETTAVAHEKRHKGRRRRMALASNRSDALTRGHCVAPSSGWAETMWTSVETGKTWVRLLAVRLPAYYAQHWSEWHGGYTNVLIDALDVPLSNDKARAFKLWLDHHGTELFPHPAAVRATWDQTCAELLRACRQQQRDHHGDAFAAFETWSFSAQPNIAYLLIEADGSAFWAWGETPMLEPIERPRFKWASNTLTVFSKDGDRSLPLPVDRLAPLQALKRRGVIQMG